MIRPLLRKLPRNLVGAFFEPRSRNTALVAGGFATLAQIAVWVLEPSWWIANGYSLIQIALFLPLAVLVGSAVTPKRGRAPEALFREPGAAKAPFLLVCAARLHQSHDAPRQRRLIGEAIRELTKEIRKSREETEYLDTVAKLIEVNSVWAVCGQKNKSSAPRFWKANETSKEAGHHIERIFFPPATADESQDLEKVLRDHFHHKMKILVFSATSTPQGARARWMLPAGFGMTLMGTSVNGSTDPASITRVLVHWGKVGEDETHRGVLLRHPLWMDFFWALYCEMRGRAQPTDATDYEGLVKLRANYKVHDSVAAV